MSDKVLVATYGSLRKGQHNHVVNERAGAVSLGEGSTKENYNLYRYNGCYFPSVSLKHNSSGTPVRVEVFETDVAGLTGPYDGLEGHYGNDDDCTFYNRTQVPVILDSGEEVLAWIYHIDRDLEEIVPHGDWVKYLNEDKE